MQRIEELLRTVGSCVPQLDPQDANRLTEIRVRSGRRTRLRFIDGTEIAGTVVDAASLRAIALRLMDESYYSRENDLREGYFTTRSGFRVGVCGKLSEDREGRLSLDAVGSLTVRVAREVLGCAEEIARDISGRTLKSALILSPPGFGKTTLIRDLARIVSDRGHNVAVADERGEIAACVDGEPSMDVGTRTDVADGGSKSRTIAMLIRASAPELVIADEIGGSDDAAAIADAARCGTAVAATAHAGSYADAERRMGIGRLLEGGVFDRVYLLGGQPGRIAERYIRRNGVYEHVKRDPVDTDYAGMHGCGKALLQRKKETERGADADSRRNSGSADPCAEFSGTDRRADAEIRSSDAL